MIQAAAEAGGPIGGLSDPPSGSVVESSTFRPNRKVQAATPGNGSKDLEGGGSLRSQSSIPRVGEEGTAISRAGILPAR